MEIQLPPPTIFDAMARVFATVGAVAKSLKNEQAGYSARSIDDVMAALHDPMAEVGIFVTPIVESAKYDVVEVGRNRTPMRQATLKVRFRFHGPAGDHVDAVTFGEALDSGDKATSKASTAAFKTALLQTFVIPVVGDTGDADATTHERSTRPQPAPKDLIDRARAAALDAGIEQWVKDQGFPWPWPQAACDAILAKIESVATAAQDAAAEPTGEEKAPESPLAETPTRGEDEPPSLDVGDDGARKGKARSPS